MAVVLAGPPPTFSKAEVPQDRWDTVAYPVFKKGQIGKPKYDRPISMTCAVSKVMEHIITSKLMCFAEGNKLLFKNQHGFRYNRSC